MRPGGWRKGVRGKRREKRIENWKRNLEKKRNTEKTSGCLGLRLGVFLVLDFWFFGFLGF